MGLFYEVVGDVAILIENGVYKQVPLYMRNGFFYAKVSGGFIKLLADGSTSKAKTRLETLTVESIPALAIDPLGRLCDLAMVPGSKPIPQEKAQKLLGIAKAEA